MCTERVHEVLRFERSEEKREGNLVEHGVDFLDAASSFDGPTIEAMDRPRSFVETRIRAIGAVGDDVLLVG